MYNSLNIYFFNKKMSEHKEGNSPIETKEITSSWVNLNKQSVEHLNNSTDIKEHPNFSFIDKAIVIVNTDNEMSDNLNKLISTFMYNSTDDSMPFVSTVVHNNDIYKSHLICFANNKEVISKDNLINLAEDACEKINPILVSIGSKVLLPQNK